jgi:hypothetical protein
MAFILGDYDKVFRQNKSQSEAQFVSECKKQGSTDSDTDIKKQYSQLKNYYSKSGSQSSSNSGGGGNAGTGIFSGVALGITSLKQAMASDSKIASVPSGEKISADEYVKSLVSGKPIGDFLKNIGSDVLEQLKRESDLRTDINENIGIAGDLSGELRDDILDSYPAVSRFGYGIQNVTDLVKNMMVESGRFNMISKDTLERSASTARAFVGDLAEMGKVFTEFEKVGMGARDAMDAIDKAGTRSLGLGLRSKTTITDMRQNIEKLNEFGFKNGIQGLAEMSRKATEFRMKMDEAFKVAETVMDPDKAIEMTANLQVLGGAIGDFNDPLKLMYDATNNVEGLQDSLIKAAGSLATYNTEQGRFEITGINLRKAREMAKTLGIDYKELTKSAIASQERMAASTALMGKGLNMKEEDKEFLTNLSRMEGGKMIIDVPQSLQKQLGLDSEHSKLALEEMSDAQVKALLENREQLKQMNPEDIAKDQFTAIKNVENDLHAIAAKILRDTSKAIQGTGPTGFQAQMDDFYKSTVKPLAEGVVSSKNNEAVELSKKIKSAMDASGMTNSVTGMLDDLKLMMSKDSQNNRSNNNANQNNTNSTQNVNVTHTVKATEQVTDEVSRAIIRRPGVWDDVFNSSQPNQYTTMPRTN